MLSEHEEIAEVSNTNDHGDFEFFWTMFSDGSEFYKRSTLFLTELRKGSYPSASDLAKLASCSKNTAQRTIDRLRQVYVLPIKYDRSRHGYWLENNNFELPLLPPEKSELTALLILREVSKIFDAKDLQQQINGLWYSYASHHSGVVKELERLAEHFSCNLTSVGMLVNMNFLDLLHAAFNRTICRISYQSPWRHKQEKTYEGQIVHLRFNDGNLYVLFKTDDRTLVLNASSIREVSFLHAKADVSREPQQIPWDGEFFGLWVAEDIEEIEIRIRPPASGYFATQCWCEEQEDAWEGELLVRKLRAAISPEIVSRLLSLGSFVEDVRPERLKQMLAAELQGLAANLNL